MLKRAEEQRSTNTLAHSSTPRQDQGATLRRYTSLIRQTVLLRFYLIYVYVKDLEWTEPRRPLRRNCRQNQRRREHIVHMALALYSSYGETLSLAC
jgi:hypothetical protein